KAEAILKEILETAGLRSARVTNTTRSFEEQAQVMIEYYKRNGAAETRKTYGTGPGGPAIEIYEKEISSKPFAEVTNHMAKVMRDAIERERSTGGQRHLMHTSDTHCAFDVDPASVADRKAFVREAAKHPK